MTVTPLRLICLAAVVAAVAAAGSALTAGTVVPATNAGTQSFAVDANALKPAACASLNLTAIVDLSGATPTTANELILGTAAADNVNSGGGADCIVGGGGDDRINGRGSSICIGGPGSDTFTQCATSIQ